VKQLSRRSMGKVHMLSTTSSNSGIGGASADGARLRSFFN
jgi:hypothetical protein